MLNESPVRPENLNMIVIPALQILDGQIVHLREGNRKDVEVRGEDPAAYARDLCRSGVGFLHLVDLNAVFGDGNNDAVIEALAEEQIGFQVGGGIRSVERAAEVLKLGADRVIVGTMFYTDTPAAKELVDQFEYRVMAALDVEDGEVRVSGWDQGTGHSIEQAVEMLQQAGAHHVTYHRIDRQRGELGPDVDGTRSLLQTDLDIYAHALVHDHSELSGLHDLTEEGLVGVIASQVQGALALDETIASA